MDLTLPLPPALFRPDYSKLPPKADHPLLHKALIELLPLLESRSVPGAHGDMPRWLKALDALPDIEINSAELTDCVTAHPMRPPGLDRLNELEAALRQLHPWRKGPFNFCGVRIDTEWRSDWKWQRLADIIDPLQDKVVLDVGCGSGYHCWRMAGAGARLTIGIEPMLLYVMQYWASRKYLGDHNAWVLPLRMEEIPANLKAFDSVFSMGVMYHRRSPMEHLMELKNALKPGGQLILETLVVEGDENTVMVPRGRYARMRNVWFLPSPAALLGWLLKVGFKTPEIVDVTTTSIDEQRTTDWMRFESLAESLDPEDPGRTVEGHPAPRRAILLARG